MTHLERDRKDGEEKTIKADSPGLSSFSPWYPRAVDKLSADIPVFSKITFSKLFLKRDRATLRADGPDMRSGSEFQIVLLVVRRMSCIKLLPLCREARRHPA